MSAFPLPPRRVCEKAATLRMLIFGRLLHIPQNVPVRIGPPESEPVRFYENRVATADPAQDFLLPLKSSS
jgi:hypothetical protein